LAVQLLQEMMKKFELEPGFPKDIDLPEPKHVLKDLTPSSVAEYIKSENCEILLFMMQPDRYLGLDFQLNY